LTTLSIEDEELDRLSDKIGVRLRPVCSQMTDLDFATMVRSIAENQLRMDRRPTLNALQRNNARPGTTRGELSEPLRILSIQL
jgi:hypothetical protein